MRERGSVYTRARLRNRHAGHPPVFERRKKNSRVSGKIDRRSRFVGVLSSRSRRVSRSRPLRTQCVCAAPPGAGFARDHGGRRGEEAV